MSTTPEGFRRREEPKKTETPVDPHVAISETVHRLTDEFFQAEGSGRVGGYGADRYDMRTSTSHGSGRSSFTGSSLGDQHVETTRHYVEKGSPDGRAIVDGKPAITIRQGSFDKENVERLARLIEERAGAKVFIEKNVKITEERRKL